MDIFSKIAWVRNSKEFKVFKANYEKKSTFFRKIHQ